MIVRPAVQRFAEAMEKILRENDHKSGWQDMEDSEIFDRITDERDELLLALNGYDDLKTIEKIKDEAVDLANFCMMLFDNNLPKSEKPEAP